MSVDKDSKILQFPGQFSAETKDQPTKTPEEYTPEQLKAAGIAVDGMSFVMVGIKPTATGADFFTAIHGKEDDIYNALPHLEGIIERAAHRTEFED